MWTFPDGRHLFATQRYALCFFMAKTLLRYYEKVETSERGRLSCGNSAACVFRRYAHERGFRHIDDSCPRIHFEPCRAQFHLRASGIRFASLTFRAVLHNNEKISPFLSVFVRHLPHIRRGFGPF